MRDVCPFADRHVYPHGYHVFTATSPSTTIAAINLSSLSRSTEERRLFLVRRVFTRSVRNHKIQEGSTARSTPSDNLESRRDVVHREHREVPRRCDPQLASSVAVAVSCATVSAIRGALKIRDLDSCNPTTSILASRIAISRSSTFPIIKVPPNLDLLSVSSFGCSVRTLAVATVIV